MRSILFVCSLQLTDFIVKEIREGIGGSGVRCGVIGEVGCSSPLTESERKGLQAAALAQQQTGVYVFVCVCVCVHPYSNCMCSWNWNFSKPQLYLPYWCIHRCTSNNPPREGQELPI